MKHRYTETCLHCAKADAERADALAKARRVMQDGRMWLVERDNMLDELKALRERYQILHRATKIHEAAIDALQARAR